MLELMQHEFLQNAFLAGTIAPILTPVLTSFLFVRPLFFACIGSEGARASGVPVRLLWIVFLMLLGVTTAEPVLVVGVLLVLALLIAPAATAMHMTHRPLTSITLSVMLGLLFTWGGLMLAFVGTGRNLPVSFYISALAAISYFVSVAIGRMRSPRRHRDLPHPCGEHIALPDSQRQSPVPSEV